MNAPRDEEMGARPVAVIPTSVNRPSSSKTSQTLVASIASRAIPRVTSTPMNRFFKGAAAGVARAVPVDVVCV